MPAATATVTRMRLVRRLVKILIYTMVGMALVLAAWLGDFVFNGRRVFYAALGRDGMVAVCTPALVEKLKASGFEPGDVAFGEAPDIALSSLDGRSLDDTFTFQDGVAQARVDGILACRIKDGAVMVVFRTRSSPVRAT